MPVTLHSCSLHGLTGRLIEVEIDILSGMPTFSIVGLGDTAIQEARERIISAIRNSGFEFPRLKKTINLAPADLKKQGPAFDLPIALGLLFASDQLPYRDELKDSFFIGELALNGNLRRVNGALLMAGFAQKRGFKRIFLPKENAYEASLIPDIEIIPVHSLKVLAKHIREEVKIVPLEAPESIRSHFSSKPLEQMLDMCHIKGLTFAKRALEISAAGAHNVLLSGPPGSGKTLLARTFSTILPRLNFQESLEVTQIYSLIGQIQSREPLIRIPPFRAVHHTASAISIIGGGRFPRPGEISLAHKGVLFLDEIAEFPVHVLETLRQPLEDHVISIGRVSGTVEFPAHFTLIAAMNPCPCGYLTDSSKPCQCSSSQILNYKKKLSGPFLDRMDLFLDVPCTNISELTADRDGESSEIIQKRVQKARDIQTKRFKDSKITTNSEMSLPQMRKHCSLDANSLKLLKQAVNMFHLSNRSYYRILKIARTIADLEGLQAINESHVAEALQYRAGRE